MKDMTARFRFNKKAGFLMLAALGVVYGDIGTSPLYAINEMYYRHGGTTITPEIIYGMIGMVVWALTLIIAVKYCIFVLRADNDHEGGVFALYSLINRRKSRGAAVVLFLLVLAAGLLFGEGIITPAISVISAVEGLDVATSAFHPFIVPITIVILTLLFMFQYKGTGKIGSVFGFIMALWFVVIAGLGLGQILLHPAILHALNPWYIISFIRTTSVHSILIVLGSVMLVVTGGEALYADMGHFGRVPIRRAWFFLVYPALLLNYLGQGAYLVGGEVIRGENIFYSMAPVQLLYPLIILATCATIIASQALISGGFSLASQAVGLGLFPRMRVVHTHDEHEGQIYMPFINWSLYVGCVLLVIIFKASTNLAAAYGLAVSGVMLITSMSMYIIARRYWHWSRAKAALVFGVFALIDAVFLTANSLKFLEGGFIPLSIGVVACVFITIWQWGRRRIREAYRAYPAFTVEEMALLKNDAQHLIPRSIVILAPDAITSLSDRVPPLLQVIWDRFQVLPQNVIFLTVDMVKEPYLYADKYQITRLQDDDDGRGSMISVVVRFGFMEDPNVESILEDLASQHEIAIDEHPKNWIIYALHERILPEHGMTVFQKIRFKIFQLLLQNSTDADEYFGLGREIGLSTEILPVRMK